MSESGMICRHFMMILALLCGLTSVACGADLVQTPVLRAFGGKILIPQYMEVVVQFRSEEVVEIRLLRKLDSTGPIRSLILARPDAAESLVTDGLDLLEVYDVNGFTVKLLGAKDALWETDLKTALISRCSEFGHLVVENREALDSYLLAASEPNCTL